jgi:hypothetical protein
MTCSWLPASDVRGGSASRCARPMGPESAQTEQAGGTHQIDHTSDRYSQEHMPSIPIPTLGNLLSPPAGHPSRNPSQRLALDNHRVGRDVESARGVSTIHPR